MASTMRQGRTSDYLIVERRRQEDMRNMMAKQTDYFKHTNLMSKWEDKTGRRLERNHVMRKVEALREKAHRNLEQRRSKLRDILELEKQEYVLELSSQQETLQQRQISMKKRAQQLKEIRETERQAIADTKRRQQWRENCNDIRTVQSKEFEKMVWETREKQLLEFKERKVTEAEQEAIFDEQWEADRRKKLEREEREGIQRTERNRDTLNILSKQLEDLAEHRRLEMQLKQEQADLLNEQIRLRQVEHQHKLDQRRVEQEKIRRELDFFNKLAIKRRLLEEQESLALDLHILQETLDKETDQRRIDYDKKMRLRRQAKAYGEYLAESKRWEQQHEAMLDAVRSADQEKIYQIQLDKYAVERQGRQKLMAEVLRIREEQIKHKLLEKEKAIEQQQIEKVALQKAIEAGECKGNEERVIAENKRKEYQHHLQQQIRFNERVNAHQRRLDVEEFQLSQQAEQEYHARLAEESKRPKDFSKLNF